MFRRSAAPLTPETALPGRSTPLPVPPVHEVLGTAMTGPWPEGAEVLYVAMGCFWGAERIFWQLPGVLSTAAGYAGGITPNPTYEETCTGRTGHTEAVQVVYDPAQVDVETLMKAFWENHDPTQLNGQGNDHGTQYRTALYPTTEAQMAAVRASLERGTMTLNASGRPPRDRAAGATPSPVGAAAARQPNASSARRAAAGSGGSSWRAAVSTSGCARANGPTGTRASVSNTLRTIAGRSSARASARRSARSANSGSAPRPPRGGASPPRRLKTRKPYWSPG